MNSYLANGLFSLADRILNETVATKVEEAFPNLDLYVPQRNEAINDKNSYADSRMIADGDDASLKKANFMIAILDGQDIDSGVACEIGVMTTLGKPVFGLYTDVRQLGRDNQDKLDALVEDGTENQFMYRNLYVIGKIKNSGGKIVSSIEDLILAIKEYYIGHNED